MWPPWSEHRSQSTGTHSGGSASPSPQHSQRCSAHSPSRGHEELRWKNKGRKYVHWYLVQWFPTFLYCLSLNCEGNTYFSEKTELQEFTAGSQLTEPALACHSVGLDLAWNKGFHLQGKNSWVTWLSWLPLTRFAWIWMNFPLQLPEGPSKMGGTDGPHGSRAYSYQLCIPGAQTKGGRAWILGGPRSLQKSWGELDLHRPLRACGCQGLPTRTRPPSWLTRGQAQTRTLVTQTYTISGAGPGQLLRSTNQTASTTLHRPALWTELFCSQKTRVLGTQHHVQQTLRSTHNLTVKRRGLMPSFTQRLPGIGFQLSQAHDEQ